MCGTRYFSDKSFKKCQLFTKYNLIVEDLTSNKSESTVIGPTVMPIM